MSGPAVAALCAFGLALALRTAGAEPVLQSAAPADTEETPEVLAPGPGRDETFYFCTACHSSAVIRRTTLTRERWDDLLTWMTERHGMPPLEGQDRALILDYLADRYGYRPKRATPFLP